jgi:hypothetical protein
MYETVSDTFLALPDRGPGAAHNTPSALSTNPRTMSIRECPRH